MPDGRVLVYGWPVVENQFPPLIRVYYTRPAGTDFGYLTPDGGYSGEALVADADSSEVAEYAEDAETNDVVDRDADAQVEGFPDVEVTDAEFSAVVESGVDYESGDAPVDSEMVDSYSEFSPQPSFDSIGESRIESEDVISSDIATDNTGSTLTIVSNDPPADDSRVSGAEETTQQNQTIDSFGMDDDALAFDLDESLHSSSIDPELVRQRIAECKLRKKMRKQRKKQSRRSPPKKVDITSANVVVGTDSTNADVDIIEEHVEHSVEVSEDAPEHGDALREADASLDSSGFPATNDEPGEANDNVEQIHQVSTQVTVDDDDQEATHLASNDHTLEDDPAMDAQEDTDFDELEQVFTENFYWLTEAYLDLGKEKAPEHELLSDIALERAQIVPEPESMLETVMAEAADRAAHLATKFEAVMRMLKEFRESQPEVGTRAFKKAVQKFRKRALGRVNELEKMGFEHARWYRYNRLVAGHLLRRLWQDNEEYVKACGRDVVDELKRMRDLVVKHDAAFKHMLQSIRMDPKLWPVFEVMA